MTCDAEQRINRALFAIKLQKGNGEWCLRNIEQLLAGPECTCEPNQPKDN